MFAGLTLDEWLQQLAGATGLVLFLTQAILLAAFADDQVKRDRFGPLIAISVGVSIAELGAVVLGQNGGDFLAALGAGIVAGGMAIASRTLVQSFGGKV